MWWRQEAGPSPDMAAPARLEFGKAGGVSGQTNAPKLGGCGGVAQLHISPPGWCGDSHFRPPSLLARPHPAGHPRFLPGGPWVPCSRGCHSCVNCTRQPPRQIPCPHPHTPLHIPCTHICTTSHVLPHTPLTCLKTPLRVLCVYPYTTPHASPQAPTFPACTLNTPYAHSYTLLHAPLQNPETPSAHTPEQPCQLLPQIPGELVPGLHCHSLGVLDLGPHIQGVSCKQGPSHGHPKNHIPGFLERPSGSGSRRQRVPEGSERLVGTARPAVGRLGAESGDTGQGP